MSGCVGAGGRRRGEAVCGGTALSERCDLGVEVRGGFLISLLFSFLNG